MERMCQGISLMGGISSVTKVLVPKILPKCHVIRVKKIHISVSFVIPKHALRLCSSSENYEVFQG